MYVLHKHFMQPVVCFLMFWLFLACTSCNREPTNTVWKIKNTQNYTVTNATLYHLSKNGTLRAIEVESGHELWRIERPDGVFEVHDFELITDNLATVWCHPGSNNIIFRILRFFHGPTKIPYRTLKVFNRESGRTEWEYRCNLRADQVLAADGILFLIGKDRYFSHPYAEIQALDLNTGNLIWALNNKEGSQKMHIWDLTRVLAYDNTLHFGAYSDDSDSPDRFKSEIHYQYHDIILDSKTGRVLKHKQYLSNPPLYRAAFNGLVFSTLRRTAHADNAKQNQITAERPNGEIVWTKNVDVWDQWLNEIRFLFTETLLYYPEKEEPNTNVSDGSAGNETYSFRIHALENMTGKEIWTTTLTSTTYMMHGRGGFESLSYPEFIISNKNIYVVGLREIYCLDGNTGSILWHSTTDTGLPAFTGKILLDVKDGVLYCSYEDEIWGFDAVTGRHKWTVPMPNSSWEFCDIVMGRYLLERIDDRIYTVDTKLSSQ